MENLIGWLLIVLIPVLVIYTAVKLRRRLEKIKQDRYEAEQRLAEERARVQRERERQRIKEREEWQARLDGAGVSAKTTYDFSSNTVRHAVKNKKTNTTTYADVPVSNLAPVNNWSTDLLTTMVIADMLSKHNDVSASTETYSKTSTDFGMDDSESRKSSTSSFSSSDSSSSFSDSSSSSSDSGPSSDW